VAVPLFLFGTLVFLTLGCGSPTTSTPLALSSNVQILTTTQMVADAIRPHLNENCSLVVLFPKGIDPHTYRPVPSDIQRLQEADAIVYNGLNLEANMESMFLHLKRSKPCLSLGSFIPNSELIPIDAHTYDPHIWFNITLFGIAAKKVADSLAKSISAPIFINNSAYIDSLIRLDSTLQTTWNSLPKSQRILCSVHDAFSYYCQKYKLRQMSLQGVSTAAEFGIFEVDAMVKFMVENKVKVAFTEAHSHAKAMKAIQLGCKQKGHTLTLGEPLLTDAPGKIGTQGERWPGMVVENTLKIQKYIAHD